jgi:hypothetical protein
VVDQKIHEQLILNQHSSPIPPTMTPHIPQLELFNDHLCWHAKLPRNTRIVVVLS